MKAILVLAWILAMRRSVSWNVDGVVIPRFIEYLMKNLQGFLITQSLNHSGPHLILTGILEFGSGIRQLKVREYGACRALSLIQICNMSCIEIVTHVAVQANTQYIIPLGDWECIFWTWAFRCVLNTVVFLISCKEIEECT